MLFSQRKKEISNKKLYINNFELEKVNVVKFLGVYIDSKLSWSEHIKVTKNKLCRAIVILIKGRKVLKFTTLLTLYYSFLYPYLTYCIEIWGRTSDVYMNQLVKTQKRSVRIRTSSYKAHTKPFFIKLNIFNIQQIYFFQVSMLMLRFKKNLLPNIFNNMFKTNANVHQYLTRNKDKLHTVSHSTELFKKGIRFNGRKFGTLFVKVLI